jgi:N-acetylglucosaminyldiphosphoundecaprenol N-acetyl-beta-D-mannosaminyltransferase
MPSIYEPLEILGVQVGRLTTGELIDSIVQATASGSRIIVAYVNIYAINLAQEQPWIKEFLNQAQLTYCDGYGVMLGARILGCRIPERYTPPDWFSRLSSIWAEHSFSMAFLGAKPGVAERAAERLKCESPGLKVVYTHDGYFDRSVGCADNETVIQAINACKPNLLVIGLGMPAQERWLLENWHKLDCQVALPIGAGFDYLAGEVRRAPRWMTDHGFEWIGRLWVEPGRLWRRYLLGIPRFLFNVSLQRLGLVRSTE